MIKEALQYLVSLKDNKIYQLDDGYTYSDHDLHRIDPPVYRKKSLEFGSLDAIVKMIRAEISEYPGMPLFIHIENYKTIYVFTRTDDQEERVFPYISKCKDTDFREGWRDQQEAIIELKSRFIPTEDSNYLLDLISRINNEQGVKSEDNGVSQTVTTKQGVTLMQTEAVKQRLTLAPFRTFREVPQPESEFILRLDDKGRVGLFEADGGIWKIEAKLNIQGYFENALKDEIANGDIVVMI